MKLFTTLLLFIILVNVQNSLAQTNAIKIINTDNKASIFSFDNLKAMPQTILNVEAEDGTFHNYEGVEIQLLLKKAGIDLGKEMRRQTLVSYMHIKAEDNYSVVYALSEIDSAFSGKKMILAVTKDGNALPANFGPLQIIATGEKKHARLIRMVTEIDVRKAE